MLYWSYMLQSCKKKRTYYNWTSSEHVEKWWVDSKKVRKGNVYSTYIRWPVGTIRCIVLSFVIYCNDVSVVHFLGTIEAIYDTCSCYFLITFLYTLVSTSHCFVGSIPIPTGTLRLGLVGKPTPPSELHFALVQSSDTLLVFRLNLF